MDNLFLARNISKEEVAISNFLDAYDKNFASSPMKSPNELFSFLLEQLSATCDVVSQEMATSESEGLVSTNQFFESIVRQLQGLEPRTFALTLSFDNFRTFIDAFQSLKSIAENYPNGSYICNRIDCFTNLLVAEATNDSNSEPEENRWSIGKIIFALTCLIIMILTTIVDFDNGSDSDTWSSDDYNFAYSDAYKRFVGTYEVDLTILQSGNLTTIVINPDGTCYFKQGDSYENYDWWPADHNGGIQFSTGGIVSPDEGGYFMNKQQTMMYWGFNNYMNQENGYKVRNIR